ncbi:AraC family transcriptional regulator [Micromonospora sp. NPDC049799]|uniref:AraC family transcriptional regulator n=1 Tax=Micromonospora sp. NPDC049799 TaxID=3154741 RepID=UPI0033D08916
MCHPAWGQALAAAQRLRDLARLRRVRDRIDREYAQPLDVEALARGAEMSAEHLSRQFRLAYGQSPHVYLMTRRVERATALLRSGAYRRRATGAAAGMPPCVGRRVTRPVRNQEALVTELHLA